MQKHILLIQLLVISALLSTSLPSCYSAYLPAGYNKRSPRTGPGNITTESAAIKLSVSHTAIEDIAVSLAINAKMAPVKLSGIKVTMQDVSDVKEKYSATDHASEFYLPENGRYFISYYFPLHRPHAIPKRVMVGIEGVASDSRNSQPFRDSVLFRRHRFLQIYH